MKEAIASLVEALARLAGATADGAAGFLLGEDILSKQQEQEEDQLQKSLDVPADSGEVKDLEQVRDSPLDSICQDLSESMDALGTSQHQQNDGFSLTPDVPSQDEGMHHSR
jgi:hypothetical protein